ncbi:MAG: hypothetical protein HZB76_01615 [Chlamydiae bacterium]|nr:hypothetical protein [Chlamydiota bacterium]
MKPSLPLSILTKLKMNQNMQRDSNKIKFTGIEEKNGSDFEGFSAAGIPVYTCKGKASIDELIFSLRTVKSILLLSQNLRQNLSGLYNLIKKSNFEFSISKKIVEEKIKGPMPSWMEKQIQNEFAFFKNKKINKNLVDETLQAFNQVCKDKKNGLCKIKIKNNKVFCANIFQVGFHSRLVRFVNFLRKTSEVIKFPDIEFLFSLSDDFENEKWLEILKVPIFVISKKANNQKVVMIPHVEWTSKNEGLIKGLQKEGLEKFPWDKKIEKGFWRGSTSGLFDFETNPRFKVTQLCQKESQFLDAYFCNLCQCTDREKESFYNNFQVKENVDPISQLQYKYLLALDGNVFPGSFFWQLFSSSVILKNESYWLEWYYAGLKADHHFIEFKRGALDLVEKIKWLQKNDTEAKKNVKNANEFSASFLTNESIASYIYRLFEGYKELIQE